MNEIQTDQTQDVQDISGVPPGLFAEPIQGVQAAQLKEGETPSPVQVEAPVEGVPPGLTAVPINQTEQQNQQHQQPKDTGVLAGIKRNTVGAVEGIYHAMHDPVTPEESAKLLQKIQEYNQTPDVQSGKL